MQRHRCESFVCIALMMDQESETGLLVVKELKPMVRLMCQSRLRNTLNLIVQMAVLNPFITKAAPTAAFHQRPSQARVEPALAVLIPLCEGIVAAGRLQDHHRTIRLLRQTWHILD